ncbi:uncharacterized protein N7503_006931 [Penicillium pulvis]|uniref:uncharacterized protein n=1 Tax=Penicillium pulvis TaxID=1562058 RepID=UPI0025491D02|nr:uncharacterized protein N7503_006931 [Penicillium pulvis]KAJ5797635.1 hypothetical protein N7503_006931 [Penicillium pulvis]
MASATNSSKRPSAWLPTEIWLRILKILNRDDRSSLKRVAMTSHQLLRIDPTSPKISFYQSQAPSYSILSTCDPFRELSEWDVDLICNLFELAERLDDFYWWHEKYMPGIILYRLYKHRPQVKVHIASSKIVICQKIHPKHTSAPQFSLIRSVSARWNLGEYDSPIKPDSAANYPAHLKDIICRCPNLETLRLIKELEWRRGFSGIHPFQARVEEEGERNDRGLITLKEGDVLPRIKNLHFQSMRFGPSQSVLWATQLQWQSLRSLSLIGIDWTHLLPKITGCFRDLDCLEISVPDPSLRYRIRNQDLPPAYFEQMDQLQSFLGALPPLTTFIGYGLPQASLAVLAGHSAGSLQHLRFRVPLNVAEFWGPEILTIERSFSASIEDLVDLPNKFPKLQSLGLSIYWTNDEWLWMKPNFKGLILPHDLLIIISRLSNIKHLELNHRDIYWSTDNTTPWPYTNLTEASCRTLIQSLDAMDTELLSLDIVIGDWYPFGCFGRCCWDGLESFITGERDQAGCMQFTKFRQFEPEDELIYVGETPPRVSPRSLKGEWSDDLRLNIESRKIRFWYERFKE